MSSQIRLIDGGTLNMAETADEVQQLVNTGGWVKLTESDDTARWVLTSNISWIKDDPVR